MSPGTALGFFWALGGKVAASFFFGCTQVVQLQLNSANYIDFRPIWLN